MESTVIILIIFNDCFSFGYADEDSLLILLLSILSLLIANAAKADVHAGKALPGRLHGSEVGVIFGRELKGAREAKYVDALLAWEEDAFWHSNVAEVAFGSIAWRYASAFTLAMALPVGFAILSVIRWSFSWF